MDTDKQPSRRGWWQSLAALVNGDREDSKLQYIAFALVVLFCIVLGIAIDILAG